jgi:Choline/Carnitine o-acyltransferase
MQHQKLTPDIFRGKPLCMDQFKALFGSSRQPKIDGDDDVVSFFSSSWQRAAHVPRRFPFVC